LILMIACQRHHCVREGAAIWKSTDVDFDSDFDFDFEEHQVSTSRRNGFLQGKRM
jgi:hypothetical protein